MPYYECKDVQTGETVDVYRESAQAPDFDRPFRHEGRRVVRPISFPSMGFVDRGFVSDQPARWDPNAPHHDSKGRAAFQNRKEAEEYCAKSEGDFVYRPDSGCEAQGPNVD